MARNQPIITSQDGRIRAHEALCRVNHCGIQGPETLFETALRVGSLWTLGGLVRRRVVEDLPQFDEAHLIFINLHPAEIDNTELLAGEAFMAPWSTRVVFEITERSAIPDLGRFKEEMARLKVLETQMLAASDEQVSLTDPDARSMATSGRGSGVVGYNVQAAVEI